MRLVWSLERRYLPILTSTPGTETKKRGITNMDMSPREFKLKIGFKRKKKSSISLYFFYKSEGAQPSKWILHFSLVCMYED